MPPEHVLILASSYLPVIGGVQRTAALLARGLQAQGHRVTVLTQRHPRRLAAAEVWDGVRVQRWWFILPRWQHLRRGRLDLFAAGLLLGPITLMRLSLWLARQRPSVVNLHFVGAPAPFILAAHVLWRFNLVVSLHGDDVQGLPNRSAFDGWVLRQTLRRAQAVTACSAALLRAALEFVPEIETKACVVHNAVEAGAAGAASQGEPVVLAVGRLEPKKGFGVLLCAWAQLAWNWPGVRLAVIGDGPEADALKALAQELGLAHEVEFRGRLRPHDVILAMQASQVVVVPSLVEPFGIVAAEAMSAGRPVVASAVGGLHEVLEGADAVLVPPNNAAALAQAIDAVLRRLEREPAYGARNRALAARFSVERMVEQYLAAYRAERRAEAGAAAAVGP